LAGTAKQRNRLLKRTSSAKWRTAGNEYRGERKREEAVGAIFKILGREGRKALNRGTKLNLPFKREKLND